MSKDNVFSYYLALGDGVVDVNSREQEGMIGLHLVKPLNSNGCLFRHTNQTLLHLVVPLRICLQPISDNGQHNLELGIVGGSWVRKSPVLLKQLLGLNALMDEQSGVTTVINYEIGLNPSLIALFFFSNVFNFLGKHSWGRKMKNTFLMFFQKKGKKINLTNFFFKKKKLG